DVSLTKDSHLIAASMADGTVRLVDFATGDELCRILTLDKGREWLVITPEGLFEGSPEARNIVRYQIGTSDEIVPVDRFFNDFYHPGLLAEVWRGERPIPSDQIALPPLVHIVSPIKSSKVDQMMQTIVVEAVDQGGGAESISLYVNERHLETDDRLERVDRKTIRRTFHVLLSHGENQIVAKAKGRAGSGTGQSEAITLTYERPPEKVTLHVAAIGVGDYRENMFDLPAAKNDALELANLFSSRSRPLFKEVKVHRLVDDEVTKENVKALFETIGKTATPDDVLLVTLAGHGYAIYDRYYFLPHPIVVKDKNQIDAAVQAQGISSDTLGEWMRVVKAQKCGMVIDTCQAGAAIQQLFLARASRSPFGFRKAIERLNRAEGIFIIAGASASAEAKEQKELGHGLLTYSLLASAGAVHVGPFKDKPIVLPNNNTATMDVLSWFSDAANKTQALMQSYYQRDIDIPVHSSGISFPLLPTLN
ncbi:MAG: caspase family protein, partial [Planctomycetaceae bacterium]|nr:caspase family protein [Planctomycetaceae bacterium]